MIHLVGGLVVLVEAWTVPGTEALLLRRALGLRRWTELLAGMHSSRGRDDAVERARDLVERQAVRPLEVELAVSRRPPMRPGPC